MLGLPDAFGVVLLGFALILALSPYLSAKDFGIFRIPGFSAHAKQRLRIIGPVALVAMILFSRPLPLPARLLPNA